MEDVLVYFKQDENFPHLFLHDKNQILFSLQIILTVKSYFNVYTANHLLNG